MNFEDLFKVPRGHNKAPKWYLKGLLATSKWHALLIIPVVSVGKCKHSILLYVSDIISSINHERNYVILLLPCFQPEVVVIYEPKASALYTRDSYYIARVH